MFGTGGSGFGGFGQQNQQNNQQQQQPGQTGGGLFGAQQQQPSTGSGFGGFGSQPTNTFGGGNTGGGLFGQSTQQQPSQSGFSFGANNATSTPFGQSTNQAKPATFGGFGASTNNATPATGGAGGFGGFGSTSNQPAASPFGATGGAFGAKPAGSLFGQPQQQNTNTFGQPAQPGGLFGSGGGLGIAPMPTQGTSNPPYDLKPQPEGPPDTPYDHDKKTPQLLNYTSITCMKPYRGASLEELRLQDYEQGRKSGTGAMGGTGSGFGQSTNTGFGAPAQSGGLFGQQPQPQQSNTFGGGGLFGQTNQQQSAQSGGLFGGANTASGGLFGQQQQQPQTGGLFGQAQNTQQQPSTGFGFGAPAQQSTSTGFSFGQNNAQQQNKPAGGGLFGGFGATNQAAPASTGLNFGGTNTQTQPAASGGFGASTGGGFGFGSTPANANQPKPGGLFGAPATSTAPTFGGFGATAGTDNKPAFSFGGSGGFGGNTAGQTSSAAPAGGLFGAAQPTTTSQPTGGFSFGAPNNTGANTGGGLFGNQQSNTGFGATSGGLFGNKPASTGGLFGQQQSTQQPASTGFTFGAPNNTNTNTTGGLFGNNQQNKPAGGGLFGSLGGNTTQQQSTGGGLFGNTQSNTNTLGAPGGGLFGDNQQSGMAGSSLFGNNNNQQSTNTGMGGGGLFGSTTTGQAGGFSFGGQNSTASGLGGSLFANSQQNNQQGQNVQVSLNSNPYGTDALFGGQAGTVNGGMLGNSTTTLHGIASQPHLPFNVSLSRSSAKKQPPIVPPFRPSSRNSIRITKLRGSTPGFRESIPGREGTPGLSNSLFASSPAPTSAYQRLSSPSPSIFRGLSDDLPRNQREGSIPASATLPPQAFVSRPSVKRLVLDDNSRGSVTGLGRSNSLFSRTTSATPTPFERDGTPARSHVNFSPALETAASNRSNKLNEGDSSFASSVFTPRKAMDETPSKGVALFGNSLPALNRSSGKINKEDSLLPLDYWTLPPLSELREWSHAELQAVEGFVVGRKGCGQVAFQSSVDLTTVGELSNIPGGIVILRLKECIVYPDEEECIDDETGKQRDGVQRGFEPRKMPGGKAIQGTGLNVSAIVKLEKCWPFDRSTRLPIKDEEHIRYKQMINKLKRRTDAHFVDFEAQSGTWSFRVDHFSRYGLDETDEDGTDEEMSEEAKEKKVKSAKGKGSDGQKGNNGKENQDDDYESPPPIKPTKVLDESTDDEEEEERMRARESGIRTPRRGDRQGIPRANVRQGSVASSTVAYQPFAASLGLEPRRVQVMQASFFGDGNNNNKKQVEGGIKGPAKVVIKQSRLASPSFSSSRPGTTASRSSFLGPVSQDAAVVIQASQPDSTTQRDDLFTPALAMGASVPRPRKFSRLELSSSSVVNGGHGIALDAGLSMGQSFRIGWGPNGIYAHSGKVLNDGSVNTGDPTDSFSSVTLSKIKIDAKSDADKEIERFERLLRTQLEHSIIECSNEDASNDDDNCPSIFPQPTLRFHHFVGPLETLSDSHYETAIFKLGSALFDEVDTKVKKPLESDKRYMEEVEKIRRRNNVANWIRWYTVETIRNEIRSQSASTSKNIGEQGIFSQLSGGFFEEACKQAIDIGDVRLATLIAQASSGGDEDEYRMDLIDQLAVWRNGGVDAFISIEYRRIIELLSGNVLYSKGNGKREEGEAVKDIKIANRLDWIRTFGLFLHFDCKFQDDLDTVLKSYESCIGGEADIVPPLPPYLEREIRPGSQKFRDAIRTGDYHRDVLFHLLKLYCNPEYPLENALQPSNYSDSKLHFSTAFHSSLLLSKVLNTRDFSDRVDLGVDDYEMVKESNLVGNSGRYDRLCIDFAMQLETINLWKWSAFILLHLEMSASRKENIMALLTRHVDEYSLSSEVEMKSQATSNDNQISFLVDTLKIPIEWLYIAKAKRASSKDDKWQEYKYCLCALDFIRAHEIAVRYLAPEGIIRHDFEFILQLFAPFQQSKNVATSQKGQIGDETAMVDATIAWEDVPGWSQGGQIIVDYVAICCQLPYLLNNVGKISSNTFASAHLGVAKGLSDKDDQNGLDKIIHLAEKIPKLMSDIRNLFEKIPQSMTITVAQTQMITSLYTCVRMLKTLSAFKGVELNLEDIQAIGGEFSDGKKEAAKGVAVEVENLQFFANDYCSMLVGAA